MKRIFSIVISLLLVISSQSVFAKGKNNQVFAKVGTFTVSGSMGYSSLGDDNSSQSVLPFTPVVGYTIWGMKRFALELQLGFDYTSTTSESTLALTRSSSLLSIDPVFYWKGLAKKGLYPFAHLALGYYSQNQDSVKPGIGEVKDEVITTSLSGYMIKPGIGISYALGQKSGGFVRAELNYAYSGVTDYGAKPAQGYSLSGLDFAVALGLFF